MVKLSVLTREVILVLFIAVLLAGAGYVFRPVDMGRISGGTTTGAGPEDGTPISVISLEDARRQFELGTALFADARPREAYISGHIAGALHLDPNEFDTWSGDFFSKTPPDQTIITYCEGERCALSQDLAEKLTWMGYEQVFLLKDGWGQWKSNHLPMASSTLSP